MIIITRTYNVESSRGGGFETVTTRKVFGDDEIQRIQNFLDERSQISGYEWKNINFEYLKL